MQSTDEAFLELCQRPDLWRRTGRPMQQRLTSLYKLNNQIRIGLETKMNILEEAGYQLAQKPAWTAPK